MDVCDLVEVYMVVGFVFFVEGCYIIVGYNMDFFEVFFLFKEWYGVIYLILILMLLKWLVWLVGLLVGMDCKFVF